MPSGWTNDYLDKLEELIRGKNAYTNIDEPYGWFEKTSDQVRRLDDEHAVELTRICLMNLAIRHSGGDLGNFTVSNEGIEHSLYRVLDLLKESVPD